jgi:hypothetical protein
MMRGFVSSRTLLRRYRHGVNLAIEVDPQRPESEDSPVDTLGSPAERTWMSAAGEDSKVRDPRAHGKRKREATRITIADRNDHIGMGPKGLSQSKAFRPVAELFTRIT